jgi:CheY-like chemotaxis protein
MIPLVLSIDDYPINQLLLQSMLEDEKFCAKFISKGSGLEALSFIKRILEGDDGSVPFPDLILLDINMPIMDGWEFIEQLSTLTCQYSKYPTIVLLTASNKQEDRDRAAAHPAVLDLVNKPLPIDFLPRLRKQPGLQRFFQTTDSFVE